MCSDEVKAYWRRALKVSKSERRKIKEMLRSDAGRKALAATVEKFPGRESSKKQRASEIEKIVEKVWCGAAVMLDWMRQPESPAAKKEMHIRLLLAKGIMAERPEPATLTGPGASNEEIALKVLMAPKLTEDEEAFLDSAGSFEKGSPAALISAMAGVMFGMEEELRNYAAREAAMADDIALGIKTSFLRGQASGEARAKADVEKIKGKMEKIRAETEKIKAELRDILKAGYTAVSGHAYRRLRKFVPDVPRVPANSFKR